MDKAGQRARTNRPTVLTSCWLWKRAVRRLGSEIQMKRAASGNGTAAGTGMRTHLAIGQGAGRRNPLRPPSARTSRWYPSPVPPRVLLLCAVASLAGCRPFVELGSTGEATGGADAAIDGGDSGTGGSGSSGGEGGTATGGSSTGGQTIAVLPCNGAPLASASTDEAGNVCRKVENEAEPTPVDVFILMDRSDSMKELVPGGTVTRWEAIRQAVSGFVNDEEVRARGIRVGLQFFAITYTYHPDINCNVDLYAEPKVSIGNLETTGQQILEEIDAMGLQLGGGTPTLPALQGAYRYTRTWAASPESGERPVVVVLVTDGFSNECQESIDIPAIANEVREEFVGEPSIRTLAVGMRRTAEGNLDQIAEAGGTVDPVFLGEEDSAAPLLERLLDITLNDMPCKHAIPAAPTRTEFIDFNEVRMVYWPDIDVVDEVQEIPKATNRAACTASAVGGWYYHPEGSSEPTEIHVCPCTCTLFREGLMEIQYGCIPGGL